MYKKLPFLSFISLLFFSFSFSLEAQTPCSSGMAGDYPCDEIELAAFIELSDMGAGLANDIWGWTAADGTEYAIVGLNNGTSFIDVSDPVNPVIIGKLPKHGSNNSTWRDIKVINDHAYIGSEATGHGIQIFDLNELTSVSNPPATFTEDGWIDLGSSSNRSHNVVSSPLTGYIIPVGTSGLNSGGLTFYDVSNPTSPTLEGSYSSAGYSHDAVCIIYRGADTNHIGKEICIGFNDNIVAITDVTDKGDPSTISTFTYPGNDYCHQGWITDDHKYLLVDDELDENGPSHPTRTYIFDISDLNSPTLKYTYTAASNSIDHNLYVKGPYAYQANYTSGLRVLDLSDLDNNEPTEIAYFDNHPTSNAGSFDGTWSVYPYFKSGTIVMTNIDHADHGGMHVITPNLPHYVIEVVGDGVESVCQGEAVTFSFDATAYSGFSNTDDISISGLPSGATATLSNSPIAPDQPFTMEVLTTSASTAGKYNIVLTGTELPVNRVSVGLEVITPNGSLPQTVLVSPLNQSTDQPLDLLFDWDPVAGATLYDLEISTDQNFTTIDFGIYDLLTTQFTQTLADSENYYWRVSAKNANCETTDTYEVRNFRTIEDPLPVELMAFTATANNRSITLDWQTASELGFAGFELQRTIGQNSQEFRKITWVPSNAANGSGIRTYQFEDKDVIEDQTYYYRLRQLDTDGSEEFSSVVTARLAGKDASLQLFPNPAEKEITLFLDRELANAEITLNIFDIAGKLVQSAAFNSQELNNGYLLNINDLEKGTYLISIDDATLQETIKFVKY